MIKRIEKVFLNKKGLIQLSIFSLVFFLYSYFYFYDSLVVVAKASSLYNYGRSSIYSGIIHHNIIPKSTRFHFEQLTRPNTSTEYERLQPKLEAALENATPLVSLISRFRVSYLMNPVNPKFYEAFQFNSFHFSVALILFTISFSIISQASLC